MNSIVREISYDGKVTVSNPEDETPSRVVDSSGIRDIRSVVDEMKSMLRRY